MIHNCCVRLLIFLELLSHFINSGAWLYADGVYSCRNETSPWRLVENDSPFQVRQTVHALIIFQLSFHNANHSTTLSEGYSCNG